jgi:hypothetical protein
VNVWLLLPVLLIGFTFGLAHFYPRPYSHLALLMIILGQYLIQGMILEFLLKRHLTHWVFDWLIPRYRFNSSRHSQESLTNAKINVIASLGRSSQGVAISVRGETHNENRENEAMFHSCENRVNSFRRRWQLEI